MAEKVQKLKLVCFDLPFVLNIGDSWRDLDLEDWSKAISEGKVPPRARHAPPGGNNSIVHLPQTFVPPYNIGLPGGLRVSLAALRRVNPTRTVKILGEVPGDRCGKSSFTSARVLIDLKQFPSEKHWDMELFCRVAVDAVNHFVEHYRVMAYRPLISPVTLSAIQEFQVHSIFDDDSTQAQVYGHGSGAMVTFVQALDPTLDSQLRAAVSKPDPAFIGETLEADILSHLDLCEWRLVVIQSAVLFEAWLSRFVRARFARKGLPATDIDMKFLKPNGEPRSAWYIATVLIEEATGYDFKATSACTDWSTKARDLRNDLVHGKRFDVTSGEANEAYQSVGAAIALLQTK